MSRLLQKVCRRAACEREFVTTRANVVYCSEHCASLVRFEGFTASLENKREKTSTSKSRNACGNPSRRNQKVSVDQQVKQRKSRCKTRSIAVDRPENSDDARRFPKVASDLHTASMHEAKESHKKIHSQRVAG